MELAARVSLGSARARSLAPGVLACGVVGAAAFLSEHYGAPVMLFALLLGMAMNFLSAEGACRPGIEFSAKQLLRVGIALLGLRITVGQVVDLGWGPIALVLVCVAATILVSMAAARLFGFQPLFGLKEVATVGLKPVLLMVGETLFLALLALVLLRWLP